MTILQSLFSPRIPFTPSTKSVINATGGNDIVIMGTLKVHIFTGPGTFTVTSAPPTTQITFAVIAGGGGGGAGGEDVSNGYCGGGGGAGGCRIGTLPLQTFSTPPTGPGPWIMPITVGAGGAGGVDNVPTTPFSPSVTGYGFNGSPSIFNIRYAPLNTNIESTGGGAGASFYLPGPGIYVGNSGGSGGGSRGPVGGSNYSIPGGQGNTPPTTPATAAGGPQGRNAAPFPSTLPGSSPIRAWGSGGGGAGGVGGPGLGGATFLGGIGSILLGYVPLAYGRSGYFAGGGEGGTRSPEPPLSPPYDGYSMYGGGLRNPNNSPTSPASPALVNTGSGGAGASGTTPGVSGGAGAPGIVVVAYTY